MKISVWGLQNDMIKPSENGGLASVIYYVTDKVLIRDTTLRSFIPPQVRKMTPKLCQICGCEICIIPKDININLNIFRTRVVTDLQQKYVVRHIHNSLFNTKSAAHYKDKVFPEAKWFTCYYQRCCSVHHLYYNLTK